MIDKKLLKESIAKYGEDEIDEICKEELAELIQALCKYKRKSRVQLPRKLLKDAVAEEMADVYIILEYIKLTKNISNADVEEWIRYKMIRTKDLVKEG